MHSGKKLAKQSGSCAVFLFLYFHAGERDGCSKPPLKGAKKDPSVDLPSAQQEAQQHRAPGRCTLVMPTPCQLLQDLAGIEFQPPTDFSNAGVPFWNPMVL